MTEPNTPVPVALTPEEWSAVIDGLCHVPYGVSGPIARKIVERVRIAPPPVAMH